jgi:hypothetical protein
LSHTAFAGRIGVPLETIAHWLKRVRGPKPHDGCFDAAVLGSYQHACLRYVSNEHMTNSSFRDRLGVDQKNYAAVSRIIREAVDAGLVRPVDPKTSKRYMKYVPFWA